jgi:hypothetical protein
MAFLLLQRQPRVVAYCSTGQCQGRGSASFLFVAHTDSDNGVRWTTRAFDGYETTSSHLGSGRVGSCRSKLHHCMAARTAVCSSTRGTGARTRRTPPDITARARGHIAADDACLGRDHRGSLLATSCASRTPRQRASADERSVTTSTAIPKEDLHGRRR